MATTMHVKEKRLKAKHSAKPNTQEALEHLERAMFLSTRFGGPTKGMSEEEIITSIKEKRNARWEAKFAARSRL